MFIQACNNLALGQHFTGIYHKLFLSPGMGASSSSEKVAGAAVGAGEVLGTHLSWSGNGKALYEHGELKSTMPFGTALIFL